MSRKILKQELLQERFIDINQYNAQDEVLSEQKQWPFRDEQKEGNADCKKSYQGFWLFSISN